MMAKLNDGYDQPHDVDDVQLVFPAGLGALLPPYESIPEDFRQNSGDARPWVKFQQQWFFKGVSKSAITPREDVDMGVALRHLSTIQGSYEPQHEHKQAAVAWLASRWLSSVDLSGGA